MEKMEMHEEEIKVLLVEDNPGDVKLVRWALKNTSQVSFKIEAVERLSEAIEHLRKNSYDIVLLDLFLPDSKGLGIISKILAESPKIPIVVLTGLDGEEVGLQ